MDGEDSAESKSKSKPKPKKLDVTIGILARDDHDARPVSLRVGAEQGGNGKSKKPKKMDPSMSFTPRAQPPGAGFDARMRLEKKGRGGQPVAIIFAVRSEALQRLGCKDLADLGRLLKQRLSCGGTVDESEVILQMRDRNRLESVLAAVGIKAQASGGF